VFRNLLSVGLRNFIRQKGYSVINVTGLMEDPPPNSHLQFSCLLSFSNMYQGTQEKYMDQWSGNINYYTYLRLREGTNAKSFEDRVNETILEFAGEDFKTYGFSFKARLQPLLSIHLDSNLESELSPNNSRKYVLIFIAVAAGICILPGDPLVDLSRSHSCSPAGGISYRRGTIPAGCPGKSRRILKIRVINPI
jgi:putative ABC transport system permease protein